ncbi:MAG: hypothetical protein AVDCRST_MAG13-3272, partial [uncultured Solirubrobacteraceae bacterium]
AVPSPEAPHRRPGAPRRRLRRRPHADPAAGVRGRPAARPVARGGARAAHGRARAARGAAPPGQRPAAGRGPGAPGAPARAARPPRRGQQVGVVVRPVPRGVPHLPAGERRPGQGGRLHRPELGRRARAREGLPAPVPPELPELHRPAREGGPGARRRGDVPHDGVLRRPRGADVHPPGAVPRRGGPRGRHRPLRARDAL